MKYIEISRYENDKLLGSYIQEPKQLLNAIDSEFFDVENFEDKAKGLKIILKVIEMKPEEYEKLPEFTGY